MKHTLIRLISAVLITSLAIPGIACGPWFPRQYLAQTAKQLLETPEFFAEIELKLLAREYLTPFKAVRDEHPQRRNAEQDFEDFDAALADGSIAPPNPTAARNAHRRMRNALTQLSKLNAAEAEALPRDTLDELRAAAFPSEFAEYHEGVLAFTLEDHATARAAWERLLSRPENERRYRSIHAAFMLGVIACVDNLDEAPKWLAMARDLAQKGFRDSSALAAASYAWDSRWHHQRGESHEAAENALRAIASGYPTRDCIEPANDSPEELEKFATDPLLRRIHTRLMLANLTGPWLDGEWNDPVTRKQQFTAWLTALETAKITDFAGAEHVAWMYYSMGDYVAAQRWLKRAPAKSPESLWLAGKLAAREGRHDESLRAMSEAARLVAARPEPALEVIQPYPDMGTTKGTLLAEHGIAALNASEFQTSLAAFLRSGHWVDAAYVAERLLTIDELKSFIAKRTWRPQWDGLSYEQLEGMSQPRVSSSEQEEYEYPLWLEESHVASDYVRTRQLRWLLARRLTRLGRFAEARPYFPTDRRRQLDHYVRSLKRARDTQLPRDQRAMALWDAALETRYNGIELLGTEVAPDWFAHDGSFEEENVEAIRTGVESPAEYDDTPPTPLPAALQAGKAERGRLRRTGTTPDKRWHYRYLAADLAWKAAGQLPSNDQRLAEMLDLAGRWLANHDEQAADRFYQALESRCDKTDIGQRAIARHWFVDIEQYTIPNRPPETSYDN